MDGIHDLGGMQGFGPIPIAKGDADFADIADWEQRMWALARNAIAQGITIDWFRHGVERMVPADYLSFKYFNKWCTNYLVLMLDSGTITMEDVLRGRMENVAPAAAPKSVEDALAITAKADISFEVPVSSDPAFGIGDQVQTERVAPAGHTRLPRYARGVTGTVIAYHGAHALPEKGAQGIEEGDHLYTIAFSARDLWGGDADPRDDVTLDLWESYFVRP